MPDTIEAHHAHLVAQYIPNPNREVIINSARSVARRALEAQDIILSHKKKMLSDAIWYLTEADGKYRTRFKSLEVMTLVWNEPASQIRIVHEHVITRVDLISRMLANSAELLENPQQLHTLLDEAVPCIVTKTEHNLLNSGAGAGWGRYATTKIAVYDTAVNPPVLFELPVVDLLE